MSLRHFYTAIALGCVVLSGCSTGSIAVRKPIIELDKYVVRPGDTVESVAYRYRLSPNDLRSINRLSGGSLLRPGLRLTIAEPAVVMANQAGVQRSRTVVVPAPVVSRQPISRIETVNAVVVPASVRPVVKEEIIESVEFEKPRKVAAKMPKPAPVVVSKSGWVWPAGGAVARGFQPHVVNRQGLDIAARSGEDVVAAADGTVVYSGKDLASQGKLVILRHKGNVLSAYSLADELFVQEDEVVRAGDTIAGLGRGENKSSILHFEIRKEGKPVNPLSYLPKR